MVTGKKGENNKATATADLECIEDTHLAPPQDWVSVQVLQEADTKTGLGVQGIYYEKHL